MRPGIRIEMHMTPIKPSDIRPLLNEPGDNLCTLIVKFIRVCILIWQDNRYTFKDDGEFTDDYKTDLCSVSCPPKTV